MQHSGEVDRVDFATRLLRWAYEGFAELGNSIHSLFTFIIKCISGDSGGMGIGATVSEVLRHGSFLSNPHEAARDVWLKRKMSIAREYFRELPAFWFSCFVSIANGAVMRTSVLGIPHFYNIPKVVAQTRDICCVTHTDLRCQASCVAVTAAISAMLKGESDIDRVIQVALTEGLKVLYASDFGLSNNNFFRLSPWKNCCCLPLIRVKRLRN